MLGPKLTVEIRQQQQLVMTPQLQQAIQLLQYSRADLLQEVQRELNENPLLEEVPREEVRESEAPGEEQRGATSAGEEAARSPQEAEVEASGREAREAEQSSGTEPSLSPGESTEGSTPDQEAIKQEIDWEAYIENSTSYTPELAQQRLRDDDLPGIEVSYSRQSTLYEHLSWQLKVAGLSAVEERIAEEIIGNLDERGYFREPSCGEVAEQLGVEEALVEEVLAELRAFEPVGLVARDLSERLLAQARARELGGLVEKIISDHLEELGRRRYRELAKRLRRRPEEIEAAARAIKRLDPHPASIFRVESTPYVTPDVYIEKVDGEYRITLNDDGMPKLRINRYYRNVLRQSGSSDEKRYVTERLNAAAGLMNSIAKRNETILKVAESILRFQYDFFERGVEALKPLVLRQIAEDIGRSESTVSRVTSNKYVHTERGIFELKFFFSSSIQGADGQDLASSAVKQKIRKLVDAEDPRRPLSDQRLVELLKGEGIMIARRTIAKYREAMKIPSSSRRRVINL